MSRGTLADADRLAVAVAAVAPAGPVLVVADGATVAQFAPRWAADFAAAGRVHRVRVGGDAAAIAAEIRSLGATVVAGIGPADACAAVVTAAAAAGLPCVCGTANSAAAPASGRQPGAADCY